MQAVPVQPSATTPRLAVGAARAMARAPTAASAQRCILNARNWLGWWARTRHRHGHNRLNPLDDPIPFEKLRIHTRLVLELRLWLAHQAKGQGTYACSATLPLPVQCLQCHVQLS